MMTMHLDDNLPQRIQVQTVWQLLDGQSQLPIVLWWLDAVVATVVLHPVIGKTLASPPFVVGLFSVLGNIDSGL
jgi:hypothetical protein